MQCSFGMVYGGPFSWRIGRLQLTSLSSCEAEWFAATTAAVYIQAYEELFGFIDAGIILPIIIICDNAGTVVLSDNDSTSKHMKHVITKLAFLQESSEHGRSILIWAKNDCMVADIGTKVLSAAPFHRHREHLVW